MQPSGQRTAAAILLAATLMAQGTPAQASEAEEMLFRGQTVTIISSAAPGGIYDSTVRALAKYLPRNIPGNPSIVVRNMVGAGGIVGANHMYSAAPKDGLTIGSLNNITPFEPLYGTKEATFEPRKFIWLGSPGYETGTLALWHDSPIKSLEDARRNEVRIGSSGIFSTPSFFARLMNVTLGTKLRPVVGYPGLNDVFLAMERGEIDGHSSIFLSALGSSRPSWLPEKKVRLLLQYGPLKDPSLPDVPSVTDLIQDPDDKVLFQAATASLGLGRPFVLPPGAPADRVAALRIAFAKTFRDPEFLAEAEQLHLGINAPMEAQDLRDLVERTYGLPESSLQRLRRIAQGKDS